MPGSASCHQTPNQLTRDKHNTTEGIKCAAPSLDIMTSPSTHRALAHALLYHSLKSTNAEKKCSKARATFARHHDESLGPLSAGACAL